MAKHDDGFDKFLESMLSGMGENNESFEEALSNMYDLAQELTNKQFYRYKRPDYRKEYDRVIPDWLGPIWNAQHDDPIRKLCEFVANDGKSISTEQKRKDCKKYLWNMFDAFKKDETCNVWKLYGLFWEMEHFGIKDLDLVFETLRQDAFFIAHYTLNVEELMVKTIYQNTGDNVDRLKDFMYQQGLVPSVKQFVFHAIAIRITQHPEERLSIVSWLLEYLNHSYEICMKGAYAGNLENYIEVLASLNIHEAMPTIEKIINDIDIPFIHYTKDIDAIWHDMKTPYQSFTKKELTLDYEVDKWDEEHKQDEDEPFDWLSQLVPDDEPDESRLIDAYSPQEKYSISVIWNELDDFMNPIGIQLIVPSNIYLHRLAQLIMISFGRKDVPSWYFVDMWGDTYTTPQSKVGKALKKKDIDFENATQHTLGDILTKKNNMIRLYLTFPDGENDWSHNITLLKSGKYGGKAMKLVRLENAHGVYPSKKIKHAADYIESYKNRKGPVPRPDIKAIRQAIDDFVEEYL